MEIPQQFIEYFENRTKKHIDLVIQKAKVLQDKYNLSNEFIKAVAKHDESKFLDPERVPYIWLTAKLNLGQQLPNDEMQSKIKEAIQHHYKCNDHHPEFFENVNNMSFEQTAHMVADTAAMAAEFGTNLGQWWESKGFKRDYDEEHISWIKDHQTFQHSG